MLRVASLVGLRSTIRAASSRVGLVSNIFPPSVAGSMLLDLALNSRRVFGTNAAVSSEVDVVCDVVYLSAVWLCFGCCSCSSLAIFVVWRVPLAVFFYYVCM